MLSGKKFKNKDVNFFNKSLDAKRRFKSLNENSDIRLEIFNTINYLSIHSKKLYLIYPVPELGFNPNLVKGLKNLKKTENLTIPKNVYKKRIEDVENIYNKINSSKIKKIKLEEIFCIFKNKCISTNKNISLYNDEEHLSKHGSRLVFNKIIDDMNN